DRARAAADRDRAAADRDQAAIDREHARAALLHAHVDELTGSYRRGVGILALQREIDRARRSGGRLVLAFVDVDGLKELNDREGHAAGDALLIDVVETIRSHLRSYDPVVRFGGDEFLCALSDLDLDSARTRFAEIQAALREVREGCSVSVGLAALRSDDSLEDLTARGDAALYEAKRGK
nr:GGDEF domain-containing protein [Actinomycetota bacterium]